MFIKVEFLLAYASHAMVIFYFIFAPLVFIAPLWAAHDSMLKAKESAILNISSQFNNDLILTYKEISSNSKRLKDNIEKIEQLKKLHDLTTSFPVWPFDTETVRRFLLTMFSPLSGVIVPAIIQYFLNYFLVH